ncbi:YecA family protein [Vibrio porteresiae]|uniref:SEC-C domain-containing protein n=1 Tax=Vibrio porteresiae DSM 19223 TaxID=1123496 RepID=A0ABZ0Q8V7_9VIBR|nr:SEC-C domain-containing protein [Vibrio porteresiae]WPC72879.1 SEC-C domain-containing protein [Vibrio porteresiae DSM 19223]
MSAIFIDNFSNPLGNVQRWNERKGWIQTPLISGINTKDLTNDLDKNAIRKLFCCLFLFDTIFVKYQDYEKIIKILGADNTIELISSESLKIILDYGEFTSDFSQNHFNLNHLGYLVGKTQKHFNFKNLKHFNVKKQNYWRYITDNNSIEINYEKSILNSMNLINNEILSDLKNESMATAMNIGKDGFASPIDHLKALRVSNVFNGLLIQKAVGAENIIQDEYSVKYMSFKFFLDNNNKFIDSFESVLNRKGIPDFYDLFKKGALTIKDVLNIRDKSIACEFRKWIKSIDYNEDDFYKELLNSTSSSSLSKITRFLYPNIIGAFNPLLGIAASFSDSFILDRIYKNWHPNIFLDDILSKKIIKIEGDYEKMIKRKEIKKYFNSVNRNDKCPCGSGKKFKNCHGNI